MFSVKFKVTVQVERHNVEAVVDTGAVVTIISEDIFKSLRVKPRCVKRVSLQTAEKSQAAISGKAVRPINLRVGTKIYEETFYMAAIAQDMLLGFDFIFSHKSVFDFEACILRINGDVIYMHVESGTPEVARVTVGKRSGPPI